MPTPVGGADGRCCCGWDERGLKEVQSANCSGVTQGLCSSLERERGRAAQEITGMFLRILTPLSHTETHTETHTHRPNTNIINKANTPTDKTSCENFCHCIAALVSFSCLLSWESYTNSKSSNKKKLCFWMYLFRLLVQSQAGEGVNVGGELLHQHFSIPCFLDKSDCYQILKKCKWNKVALKMLERMGMFHPHAGILGKFLHLWRYAKVWLGAQGVVLIVVLLCSSRQVRQDQNEIHNNYFFKL